MDAVALGTAIVGALIYAVGGYLKSGEDFNEEKFAVTLILGLIIGAFSYQIGSSYDVTSQVLANAGLVVLIEKYGKALFRWVKNKLTQKEQSAT